MYQGPSTGRATVPSSLLAGSAQARLRVSVNDGFAEATAASSAFTTEGSLPKANIIAPEPGGTVRAGEATLLTGSALDDQMRSLKGKALTWFAGRKRLGTGPQIKAPLPAGKVTLKLVARDRNGLTGTATLPLRVEARRLRVVSVSVPQKVGKSARTVTVTISTSARSTLTAAGRRLRVGTKATKLTIPLPKKPAVGVLRVPFKLSATDRAVKGTVKGAISVVRT